MRINKFFNKWMQRLSIILLFLSAMLICMCHGASPLVERLDADEDIIYPTSSTSKEMITGTGGYDYGTLVPDSIHTQFGIDCMNNCHMAPDMEWPDEDGAEAFILISPDGEEYIEVCNKCHPPAVGMGLHSFNGTRFNRAAIRDYDGDGTAEGVQDEVRGLLDVLLKAIQASGVTPVEHEPYWQNVTTVAQKLAIYNLSFVNHDKSMGVHNTARSVHLLQSSYKNLTGQEIPGADVYSHVPVPEVKPSPVVIEPVMEIEGVGDNKGMPIKGTGLPNVGMGTYVLLRGFSLDTTRDNPVKSVKWSLTPPDGSKATLKKVDKEHVYFLADKMAWYEVKLSVTDAKGRTNDGVLRIHSAFYVGVGGVAGTTAAAPQCGSCHPEGSKSWAETVHAKAFARAIDGGDYPVPSQFHRHHLNIYTLGYNIEAENCGFDDIAAKVGWNFPLPEMQWPGNWDAMPVELKQVASVQCESCHGPGGRWTGASISLSAESCGYCHDGAIRNDKYGQWSNSVHAHATFYTSTHSFSGDKKSCLPCHSAEGFIDLTAGKQGSLRRFTGRAGSQSVTCAVCHDPHSAEYESQLRIYGGITLYDGTKVTQAGASAVCMMCHNGRFGPEQVDKDDPKYPHYSTAAEMIAGTGGYDYGKAVEDSTHTSIGISCVNCHMAKTPGWVNGKAEGKGLPGHYVIGGHTLTMISKDGVQNIAACNKCHSGITDFNRDMKHDYDGNGTAGGIQDEVQGLLDILLKAIRESGVEVLDKYPYWKNVNTQAQKAAIYNWSFVRYDRSLGIHNTARSVQLLQRSYKDLTGKNIAGADLR